LLLAGVVCIAACDTSGEWLGTTEEVDGVVRVANPAYPLWGTSAEGEPRLSFELKQVFGVDREPADAILGDQHELYVDVDPDGSVYVLDGQADQLVAFAPDGRVRWRAGHTGEGPGEFREPAGIGVSAAGSLVVLNHSRTRLDTWSVDGSFVSSIRISEPPLSAIGLPLTFISGFLDSNRLVFFAGIRGGTGSRVAVLDMAVPAVSQEFEWNQLPDFEMPRNVSSEAPVRAARGMIFVGSGAGYQFRVYSDNGAVLRHVTREVDYPVRSGFVDDDRGQGVAGFGEVLAPMPLDANYLLVCVSWVRNVEDPDALAGQRIQALREGRFSIPPGHASSFDLYDRQGRLLYSIVEEGFRWPTTGEPQFIGPDDRLYTIAGDPFPQIRRYRVAVSAPS